VGWDRDLGSGLRPPPGRDRGARPPSYRRGWRP